MKKISIIIVNYNVEHFLHICLQSVFDAIKQLDAEVIVVDNHSSDASCEMVKTLFPDVILIENKVNIGFSKANNQGVEIAKGEYILILNPDTILAENTLINITSFADNQTHLGALGIRLIDGTGNFLFESKRNTPTPKRAFFKLLSNANEKLGYYANQVNQFENSEIEILVGAFMMLKKDVYLKMNGFDERFFMYGEDIDLCYRLLKAGYKNYYIGSETAIHFKGESTQKDIKYLTYFYGAMKLFYRKHFKSNKVYDFIMSIGIRCWFWVKYFRLLFLKEKVSNHSNILLIGNDNAVLKKISSLYTLSNLHVLESDFFDDIEPEIQLKKIQNKLISSKIDVVIFDRDMISFSNIINFMDKLQNKTITFKIKPHKGEFIIGSNCSIGKGFVEKF